jgi:hypothetical protein
MSWRTQIKYITIKPGSCGFGGASASMMSNVSVSLSEKMEVFHEK